MFNLTKDNVTMIYLNTSNDPKVLLALKRMKMYIVNTDRKSCEYLKSLNNLVKRRTELLDRAECANLDAYIQKTGEKLNVITVVVDNAELCKRHKVLVEVLSAVQEYCIRVGIAVVMQSPNKYIPDFNVEGNALVQYGSSYILDVATGKIVQEIGRD